MLLLSEPEVPISSMVVVPVGARREALQVIVTVALPLAGGVTGFAEAVADTPLGNSFTLKSTAELNPFTLVMVSVVDAVPRSSMVKEAGDRDRVKFLVPDEEGFTVSETEVVAVKLPDVPVMVTVAVPVAAVPFAVRVSVLVEVAGFVLNAAVTPLGRPEAARVTLPENPPKSLTVIVLVPLLPWVMVKLLGDELSVKLGVDDEPARALIRPLPFGLPQPVAKSYPVVAE
jgi:hypothetical protein